MSFSELFRVKVFWLLMAMMLCAGASEQAVSQWASTFAEKGLHIQKTVGDLVGPMMFSVLMGLSRLIYGKYGEKLNLDRFMKGKLCTVRCFVFVHFPCAGSDSWTDWLCDLWIFCGNYVVRGLSVRHRQP